MRDVKIEIWSDIACPWCFIGKRRFETALASFEHRDDVDVHWRSYQLDPTLPDRYEGTETQYLSQAKGMDADRIRDMFAHVREQAAGEGLAYDFDAVVVANSFTAHRFLHLAGEHSLQTEAKEALLSGHFERGEDIGSIDYLARVGAGLGLDAGEVRDALDGDRFAQTVRDDIASGRALGVTGVPFFVLDRKYGISGAQPVEVFTQTLDQAWAEAHPLQMVTEASGRAGADGEVCGPDGCS